MNRSVLFLLAVAACGDDAAPSTDAGSSTRDAGSTRDSGATDGGERDAGSTPADGGSTDGGATDAGSTDAGSDIVMCGASEVVFPTFDRSCVDETDCYVAVHQIDCCGTFIATGIAAGESARFDAAEMVCQAMYPRCRCLARPTMADDGTTSTGVGEATLQCIDSICTTSFDPR
jgi:hypothetical protein